MTIGRTIDLQWPCRCYSPSKNIDFAWWRLQPITISGVWKNVCPQFVPDFYGFEKMDEKSKEVFNHTGILSEKPELNLQEDSFSELLAAQHEELGNEELMELETEKGPRETRRRRSN